MTSMHFSALSLNLGNVSKDRCPKTGQNYRPKLELVHCAISRRVYTNNHMHFVVEGGEAPLRAP